MIRRPRREVGGERTGGVPNRRKPLSADQRTQQQRTRVKDERSACGRRGTRERSVPPRIRVGWLAATLEGNTPLPGDASGTKLQKKGLCNGFSGLSHVTTHWDKVTGQEENKAEELQQLQ